MNQYLKTIQELLQQNKKLAEADKEAIIKAIADADKQWSITDFKLDRTEKVKKTTAILLEETIEELEQKRKAVEAQNRELEIESSLEKVRTVAMGMRNRDDMLDICRIISEQLESLGIKEIRNVQTAIFYKDKGTYVNYEYYRRHDKALVTEVDYTIDTLSSVFAEKMMKGADEVFIRSLAGKEVKDWLNFQKTTNVFIDPYLETATSLTYYWFSLGPVAIGTSSYVPLSEEELGLFKRFRNVFGLAYQRYIDIEKAEAQAREAQIEAALERVRSRAMAMHKTDQLLDAAELVYKELTHLGITSMAVSYAFVNEQEKNALYYGINPVDGKIPPVPFVFPHTETDVMRSILSSWKKQETFNRIELDEKATLKHQTWVGEHIQTTLAKNNIPFSVEAFLAVSPKTAELYTFNFAQGYLFVIGEERVSAMQEEMLLRFTKVFEMTYRRFLDLKQAEAQAREAQIQLSLERVRAKAMAMYHSDELNDVLSVLIEQFDVLGIFPMKAVLSLFDLEKNIFTFRTTGRAGQRIIGEQVFDINSNEVFKGVAGIWKNSKPNSVFTNFISKEDLPQVWELFPYTFANMPKEAWVYPADYPDGLYNIFGYCKFGYIGFDHTRPATEEEKTIIVRFANEFERLYQRFLDLQKAEALAREGQIELGLERVRARAMAMQHSDELKELIGTVYAELTKLNISLDRCLIWVMNSEDFSAKLWMAGAESLPVSFYVPYHENPPYLAFIKGWKERNAKWEYDLGGQIKKDWDEFVFSNTEMRHLPDRLKKGMQASERIIMAGSFQKFGCLQTAGPEPLKEEQFEVLNRFTKVFDSTYTRFNDLQKAEAQAREAQIELGLERVRARAMAMQKSDELSELVDTVFKELTKLDFALTWCIINIIDEPSLSNTVWAANPEIDKMPESYHMKFEDYPFHHAMMKGWKERNTKCVYTLEGQEKKVYDEYLFNETEFRRVPAAAQTASRAMERYVVTFSFSNFGGLQTVGDTPLSEANLDILSRFGKVFDLTYTRFNDLRLAEAQTREAEIQLALERVRARSLAMHHTSELQDVVNILAQQLHNINIDINGGVFICINDEVDNDLPLWASAGAADYVQKIVVPFLDKPFYTRLRDAIKKGNNFYVEESGRKEKIELFQHLFKHEPWSSSPQERKEQLLSREGGLARSVAISRYTSIAITDHYGKKFSDEDNNILKRFGNVFEQSYTRFLDLQKAEAQARESQIQLALERVRARTMAMQDSDELKDAASLLFKQLEDLGVKSWSSGFNIWQHNGISATINMCNPDGSIATPYHLPHTENNFFIRIGEARQRGDDLLVMETGGKELEDTYNYMFSMPEVKKMLGGMEETGFQIPKFQVSHCAFFSQGYLMFITYEAVPEMWDVFKRFAKVFEQTYTRFLDLQKAEAQAREGQIEAALERVRSRSMGMQKSEELKEVIQVVYDQFVHLNIKIEHTGFVVDYKARDDYDIWIADPLGVPSQVTVPYFDSVYYNRFNEAKGKGENFFATNLSFEEKNKFYQKLFEYVPGLPDEAKKFYFSCPGLAASTVLLDNICLYIENFSGTPYSDEENNTLMRFGKVFQQTYTRFLDLQKAEAQAREAKIEMALEKVRSKTIAMHNSQDVADTVATMFDELVKLGIETIRCGIGIMHDTKQMEAWTAKSNANGKADLIIGSLDMTMHPLLQGAYNGWKNKEESSSYELTGDDLINYYILINNHSNYPIKYDISSLPSKISHNDFYFPEGTLYVFSLETLSAESSKIFKRFAGVFGQTYRRYLDLQKAEAQAREAKIEASLEKVRSRTMAMQRSEELGEAAALLFQQVQAFGIKSWTCGFNIWEPDDISIRSYMAKPDGTFEGQFLYGLRLPHTEHPHFIQSYEARKRGEDFFVIEQGGEELKDTYRYMFSFPEFEKVFGNWGDSGFPLPAFQISHYIFFSQGYLLFITYKPVPEMWDIFKRFGKVFEQTYTRFLDLQKAEAQAREAQIEASLERVRSKTMAMHNSQDVGDTVSTMFAEFVNLGIYTNRCGILIFNSKDSAEVWTARSNPEGKATLIIGRLNLNSHKLLSSVYEAWKAKESFYQYDLLEDDLKRYYEAINKSEYYRIKFDIKSLPSKEFHSDFFFPEGAVFAFTGESIVEEHSKIIKRFAGVFGQTYRRYLDLQKAEAQAREAKIEAALEKVRSCSLAMHKSDELREVVAVIYEQLQQLGFVQEGSCNINIMDASTGNVDWWMTGFGNQKYPHRYHVEYINHPMHITQLAVWKSGEKYTTIEVAGESKKEFDKLMLGQADFERMSEETKMMIASLDRAIFSMAFMKYGALSWAANPITDEQANILQRFARVFEQAYTRFLDLQKAEAQAREATIEAALEKVRGKAMAMHNSNDLSVTASLVFTELRKLGISPIRCGVGLLSKKTRKAQLYSATSSADGDSLSLVGWVVLSGHPVLENIYDTWLKNEDYYPELAGEQLKSYYELLLAGLSVTVPDWQSGQKQYGHFLPFSVGCLYAWSDVPYNDAEIKILKRFATIIDLTFRRYIELQTSEANAREAVKQAALDRIRADIASMRTVTDLDRITPLIWNELTILGIPFIRSGVFIMDDSQQLIHTFLSTPDGKAIAAFHLPYDTPGNLSKVVSHWKNNKNYIDHWDETAFTELAGILVKQGAIASPRQYLDSIPHGGFHLHFLPFLQGMLYVGNTARLNDEAIKLIQSVAEAFSTAYARYEDFNKLEAAKQQVEKTLVDLKQAQTQLVQSEKMASLGELTAGIAHEIQNPLNFVNNFSEVSNELLDEMKAELDKGDADEAKVIADDVKQNLEKILHHGKRADAIVKGMLQHSRSSSGVKEPTDINMLADEYLRLTYHGLRAKDKTFNASIKTDFDNSIGNINIIPQDIGRAILNLLTNAFYAVTQKKKLNIDRYEPTVSLSTKKIGDKIEIRVSDNGNGIPQKVLDKIFQPFFTTKPTGQGTGLGLSLSYDIITKGHGGELKVETKEEEGTMFIVMLPG